MVKMDVKHSLTASCLYKVTAIICNNPAFFDNIALYKNTMCIAE